MVDEVLPSVGGGRFQDPSGGHSDGRSVCGGGCHALPSQVLVHLVVVVLLHRGGGVHGRVLDVVQPSLGVGLVSQPKGERGSRSGAVLAKEVYRDLDVHGAPQIAGIARSAGRVGDCRDDGENPVDCGDRRRVDW